MKDNFVHLHVHTEYSLLDGAAKVEGLAAEAARLGQPAVAMTDHGNLSGAHNFWKACNNHGVKPIIGCEFYVAPAHRAAKHAVYYGEGTIDKQRDVSGSGAYTHLTVIAKNSTGLRNLYQLQARAYSEGFYRKPRIDKALLEEYSEGLIVLSGCLGSELQTRLKLGQDREAVEYIDWGLQVFGDRFFIEIMDHGLPIEKEINPKLIDLCRRFFVPLVQTNDSHYTSPEDKDVHDAMLCLQTNSKLSDEKRFRFDGDGYHLKSRAELTLPYGLDATLLIAEMVEKYDNFDHTLRMPRSKHEDEIAEIRRLTFGGTLSEAERSRAEYELGVITGLGYEGYFLVLSDIIRTAKQRGIRIGPGRGSAGGSLVAYRLGITDMDPIKHGLLFERFLNPERASLPDIDVDVAEHQRDEFLAIVREYVGEGHVATIGTFGTIGAKAALHDAARVMGSPRSESNRLAALLPPPKFGRQPSLDECRFVGEGSLVLPLARGLEGLIRNQGQHAAGVIISPDPLYDILPLWKQGGKGHDITGFTMKSVEDLGLVKMDFLGLRNLTVIDETLTAISMDWNDLPTTPEGCNDDATYRLLASGETLGVFQLDSNLMQGLLRAISPSQFSDIANVLLLGRPGPMGSGAHTQFAKRKAGSVPSTAIHPELDFPDILGDTYNLLVCQEQVLKLLERVCGWSYAEADLVFGAMRKKDHEKMEASRPKLYAAGRARGFSDEALDALWETLVPFADYSFNLAHSAGYGLVAYWTAYLKANHTTAYLTALLGSVSDDAEKLATYLHETERLGVRILPPDVNESRSGFTAANGGIRYGLSAVRGVGEKAYEAIAKHRPYGTLDDFYRRADAKALNVGVLKALVKSGAMDSLYTPRGEHLEQCERLAEVALEYRSKPAGDSLFGNTVTYQPIHSFQVDDSVALRAWELETLGTSISKPTFTFRVERPLNESDWAYIRSTLLGNDANFKLYFRGTLVHSGTCSLSEAKQLTLSNLGVQIRAAGI